MRTALKLIEKVRSASHNLEWNREGHARKNSLHERSFPLFVGQVPAESCGLTALTDEVSARDYRPAWRSSPTHLHLGSR